MPASHLCVASGDGVMISWKSSALFSFSIWGHFVFYPATVPWSNGTVWKHQHCSEIACDALDMCLRKRSYGWKIRDSLRGDFIIEILCSHSVVKKSNSYMTQEHLHNCTWIVKYQIKKIPSVVDKYTETKFDGTPVLKIIFRYFWFISL